MMFLPMERELVNIYCQEKTRQARQEELIRIARMYSPETSTNLFVTIINAIKRIFSLQVADQAPNTRQEFEKARMHF